MNSKEYAQGLLRAFKYGIITRTEFMERAANLDEENEIMALMELDKIPNYFASSNYFAKKELKDVILDD